MVCRIRKTSSSIVQKMTSLRRRSIVTLISPFIPPFCLITNKQISFPRLSIIYKFPPFPLLLFRFYQRVLNKICILWINSNICNGPRNFKNESPSGISWKHSFREKQVGSRLERSLSFDTRWISFGAWPSSKAIFCFCQRLSSSVEFTHELTVTMSSPIFQSARRWILITSLSRWHRC